ncbi:hypothetical protein [Pseudoalteromonas sp. T1lg48]|uniref:hypothetical protein n=1 Tax=Pseudoalteromonas sp. T1lg48 TaxID=2077100 RepID=UPI000CF7431B|nr:hypothetical protein [Pseudoalteromonas sp. T1lg48]
MHLERVTITRSVGNAAGYHFNNLYGFGRVDAGAAVKMAFNYDVDSGEREQTPWLGVGVQAEQGSLNLTIADDNAGERPIASKLPKT